MLSGMFKAFAILNLLAAWSSLKEISPDWLGLVNLVLGVIGYGIGEAISNE